jgi:SAM-dependent methyltransferase
MPSQEIFHSVYRGRQGPLHHRAYMRTAKVLLALQVLRRAGFDLEGKSIFDYGFGAGTFYRHCPKSARLFGVEVDPENVAAVQARLRADGRPEVHLEVIDIARWAEHPLLGRQYDLVLCSHVLEHLEEPLRFLARIKDCLGPRSILLGLVPINERAVNPQHVQVVDRRKVEAWAAGSGLQVRLYLEADPWIYWMQPLFTANSGPRHLLAQVVSLGLGLPAALLGPRLWGALSPAFARLTFSKPTQAAFVLGRGGPAPGSVG